MCWLFAPHLCFQGLQNLLDRIERMRVLGPEFIDITWHVLPHPFIHQKY